MKIKKIPTNKFHLHRIRSGNIKMKFEQLGEDIFSYVPILESNEVVDKTPISNTPKLIEKNFLLLLSDNQTRRTSNLIPIARTKKEESVPQNMVYNTGTIVFNLVSAPKGSTLNVESQPTVTKKKKKQRYLACWIRK